ncbi:MAG: carboxypeptidase regulatory-like domain-containing protein, partial [Bacteroidota bacterium]
YPSNPTRSVIDDSFYTEFNIWYPARSSRRGQPLKLSYFFRQDQRRLARLYPEFDWNGYANESAQYFGQLTGSNQNIEFSQRRTSSYRNANQIEGRFPLLLYFGSSQNSAIENVGLFEYLSTRGFVVAVIPPMNNPLSNNTTRDAVAEMNEATSIWQFMIKQNYVDSSQLAVIGLHSGGLSAVLYSSLIEEIDAVLSIDGEDIGYHYSSNKGDHESKISGDNKPFFPELITRPYLHIGSDKNLRSLLEVDSIYNPLPKSQGPNYYIRFKGLSSIDMSSMSFSVGGKERAITSQENSGFLYPVIFNFLNAALNKDMTPFSNALEDYAFNNEKTLKLFLPQTNYDTYEIRGKVVDKEGGRPISYARLQLSDAQIGTLGGAKGQYRLNYLEEHRNLKVAVFAPGYYTQTYELEKLWSMPPDSAVISLTRKIKQPPYQDTIKIINYMLVPKDIKPAKFFSASYLPSLSIGQEIGSLFSFGEDEALIKSVQFGISSNSSEKIVLRPNFYTVKNGRPFENITPDNISLQVSGDTGKLSIDLEGFNLRAKGEIFVSLELTDIAGDDTKFSFTSKLTEVPAFIKPAHSSQWNKYPGLSPAFELEVTYINYD